MLAPLYICGSTATGKSSVALHLAQALNGEIINADAYQIYQGIETIAANPSDEDLSQVTHHLYSHLPLTTELNAAKYKALADPIIEDVISRGKVPLITGGSGMYLKFLTHGPSPIPASDPTVRATLDARELPDLIEELRSLDPEVLDTFPPENKRYVIRALEICLMTGQKASTLKSDWERLPNPAPQGILVAPSKEETLLSIEARTDAMLSNGAIEEVAGLPENMPTAGKAIGIREIQNYLSGEWTLEECRERLIISTRQYAKRQRNWFRGETWLKPFHPTERDAITQYAQSLS